MITRGLSCNRVEFGHFERGGGGGGGDEDKGISFTEQEKWYVIKLLFSVLTFEITDYRVFY